jgi:hypothetical protein
LRVVSLTSNNVETVNSGSSADLQASTDITVRGATSGVDLRGNGSLLIREIEAGQANVNLSAATDILNRSSGGVDQPTVTGGTTVANAGRDIGEQGAAVVFNVQGGGTLTLIADNAFYDTTNDGVPVNLIVSGVAFNAKSFASTQSSTQSAVLDTTAIDWAALDPNEAIVDCAQPCVRLPGDQAEDDEELAKVREASKLLLIRTSDGFKLIPVFPLETTAAVR